MNFITHLRTENEEFEYVDEGRTNERIFVDDPPRQPSPFPPPVTPEVTQPEPPEPEVVPPEVVQPEVISPEQAEESGVEMKTKPGTPVTFMEELATEEIYDEPPQREPAEAPEPYLNVQLVKVEKPIVVVPPPTFLGPPAPPERPKAPARSVKRKSISLFASPPPVVPLVKEEKRKNVVRDTAVRDALERERKAEERKRKAAEKFERMKKRRGKSQPVQPPSPEAQLAMQGCFLDQFSIVEPGKANYYKRVFESFDSDGDGYLDGGQALEAIDQLLPADVLADSDIEYIYRLLEMADCPVYEGKMNLELFNIVVSLARRISSMDEFMKGLLDRFDFKSLDSKFFRARQLFERLIDDHERRTMSVDCLLLEIRAGGLPRTSEREVRRSLEKFRHFDLIDFLTYLPLFTLIHSHVVGNPLAHDHAIPV